MIDRGKGQLVGWAVVLTIWTGCSIGLKCIKDAEITNTAEDMIEWIEWDVYNGYVDSTRADSYIDNLEEIIKMNK